MKANSAPISTFLTNSSNRIFKDDRIANLRCYKYPDAVTSFLSTLHSQFGPCTQELGLTDECGIPLIHGWAAAALLQLCDKAAVWANHRFPAHASAGIAWEDFSAAVKQVFIPPDAVTRLKQDWGLLSMKGDEHVSAFNERFRVL